VFVTMVFHHPLPEHRADFLAFMQRVEEGMRGTEGLLSLESYEDTAREDRLVAIGRWDSAASAQAGVARLMGIGGRDPRWTAEPDEVFQLSR
jgi:quinol monooxygenase YgiN